MALSPEQQASPQPAADAATSTVEPQTSTNSEQPPSPTRSDRSTESEGKPMREKLKETRIDAQGTSDPVPSSDQPMNDAPNGTRGDQSTSGSESERGRLRRKRSRENFEDDQDEPKHPEKKHERHVRKKSRDVTSPVELGIDVTIQPHKTSVSRIDEKDGDEAMQSFEEPASTMAATARQATPDAGVSDKEANTVTSPKNKRTREQAEASHQASVDATTEAAKDTSETAKVEDERTTKRPRDAADPLPAAGTTETKTKIPPGSGFANTSSTSPFATMAPKLKASEKPAEDVPQTSDDKFKKSGFSAFSSASASPLGALGGSGSSSPFAAASGTKITSFASSTATSSKPSGFATLGSRGGGSTFGGGLGGTKPAFGSTMGSSGFSSIGGAKLSTFGSGGGSSITGLTQRPEMFGAPQQQGAVNDDDGSENGDDDADNEDDEDAEGHSPNERRSSQQLLQAQGPPETGEENEATIWTGRAKLYTLAGEGTDRKWHERGVGPLKLNETIDEPKKARFVLRADGTHRLLLNVAVTKNLKFGDAQGGKPNDGRVLFNAPKANGELEAHQLKLRSERAEDLWTHVRKLQESL